LADRIIEALYDRQGQSIWLDEVLRDAKAKNRALAEALEELARRGHRADALGSASCLATGVGRAPDRAHASRPPGRQARDLL
jgi:hypothetical protein